MKFEEKKMIDPAKCDPLRWYDFKEFRPKMGSQILTGPWNIDEVQAHHRISDFLIDRYTKIANFKWRPAGPMPDDEYRPYWEKVEPGKASPPGHYIVRYDNINGPVYWIAHNEKEQDHPNNGDFDYYKDYYIHKIRE